MAELELVAGAMGRLVAAFLWVGLTDRAFGRPRDFRCEVALLGTAVVKTDAGEEEEEEGEDSL